MTRKPKPSSAKTVTLDAAQMKSVVTTQPDFLRPVVQEAVQTILALEREECLQAGKRERSDQRLGCRSGDYRRRWITRVGTMILRGPQDRAGHFSTQVFEQYQRSEKALVAALAQRYVQGVSTRQVAAITEEWCGHNFQRVEPQRDYGPAGGAARSVQSAAAAGGVSVCGGGCAL